MKLRYVQSTYVLASWFFKKNIISGLINILGVGINKAYIGLGFDIVIVINAKYVYPVIFFLNKHSLTCFKNLVDIVCYDTPNLKYRFSLVYNLIGLKYNLRCQLLTKIKQKDYVFSITGVHNCAAWFEREVFDFFGVFFFGNKDLRRILTDYGFNGFPLRKDFPLTGYNDVYYDDNQKRICYRSLELTQEYKNFKLKSL